MKAFGENQIIRKSGQKEEKMRRRYNIMSTLSLVVMSAFLFSGIAFGASFTNGSFELPGGTPPIRRSLVTNDGYVTGWINNGGDQIYESGGQEVIAAGDGTYYVSFGHNGASGGTLSQTFDTIVGGHYMVNYLVTLQQGNEPESMRVEAYGFGSSLLNSAILNNFGNPSWTSGPQLTFTATSPSTTLIFTDTTVGGGQANWGLDAVTVRMAEPNAAPEPTTMLLLGLGLIGLAGVRRKFQN